MRRVRLAQRELEAIRLAARQGIVALPLSSLTVDLDLPPAIRLGAVATHIPAIRRGIEQLGAVLRGVRKEGGPMEARPRKEPAVELSGRARSRGGALR